LAVIATLTKGYDLNYIWKHSTAARPRTPQANWDHVLALESNGTVLAWGRGSYCALGNGDYVADSGPVQVTGLTTASQVSVGGDFSLAVYQPPRLARKPVRRAGS
jgi:alpha-tubulin suppressor-like RCC1 family protein